MPASRAFARWALGCTLSAERTTRSFALVALTVTRPWCAIPLDMKASGFVAQALARHGIEGASVAPAAEV